MVKSMRPTIVIVPGLRGEVEDHWQTRLAARLPLVRCLPAIGRDRYDLDERVAALDEAVNSAEGPVIMVAHSAGVLTTVHWADRHYSPVHAALLATPPDLASPLPSEYPSLPALEANGWLPIPLDPLWFPSIVAASSNDPIGERTRIRTLADAWGSRYVDLGPVGHLNPASGFGDWPQAEALIDELSSPLLAGEVGCLA